MGKKIIKHKTIRQRKNRMNGGSLSDAELSYNNRIKISNEVGKKLKEMDEKYAFSNAQKASTKAANTRLKVNKSYESTLPLYISQITKHDKSINFGVNPSFGYKPTKKGWFRNPFKS